MSSETGETPIGCLRHRERDGYPKAFSASCCACAFYHGINVGASKAIAAALVEGYDKGRRETLTRLAAELEAVAKEWLIEGEGGQV